MLHRRTTDDSDEDRGTRVESVASGEAAPSPSWVVGFDEDRQRRMETGDKLLFVWIVVVVVKLEFALLTTSAGDDISVVVVVEERFRFGVLQCSDVEGGAAPSLTQLTQVLPIIGFEVVMCVGRVFFFVCEAETLCVFTLTVCCLP